MSLELITAIHRCTHQIALFLERHKGELGVTQAEAHVLGFLAQAEVRSVGELHHSFGHRRSTLTSILDRLEGRGLLAREINPDDRRSFLLRLTPPGRELAKRVLDLLQGLEASALQGVGESGLQRFLSLAAKLEKAASE